MPKLHIHIPNVQELMSICMWPQGCGLMWRERERLLLVPSTCNSYRTKRHEMMDFIGILCSISPHSSGLALSRTSSHSFPSCKHSTSHNFAVVAFTYLHRFYTLEAQRLWIEKDDWTWCQRVGLWKFYDARSPNVNGDHCHQFISTTLQCKVGDRPIEGIVECHRIYWSEYICKIVHYKME